MILKKLNCFLFLLVFGFVASAQTSLQFIPEVYGRNMDGLMHVSIINQSTGFNARLNITVTERRNGKVVSLQTGIFSVGRGSTVLPSSAARGASLQFGSTKLATFVQRNGYFPEGSYDYEFNLISASSSSEQIVIDQTFSQDLAPIAPMDLIAPYDNEEICEKRPLFSWQPLIPVINGSSYSLLLVEVKNAQNPVEALNYNLPIVNQKGIPVNLLVFPSNAKELQPDKKYAWQVTAYKDETVLNRSEIWSFKINCKDSVSEILEVDYGYRDIDDLVKGNYYVAEGFVKFALVNAYQEQRLKFEVSCITDPRIKVKSLPKITLKRGQNKIRLDISHNNAFKDGYSYILKVMMPNGVNKNLRFIYKDTD